MNAKGKRKPMTVAAIMENSEPDALSATGPVGSREERGGGSGLTLSS